MTELYNPATASRIQLKDDAQVERYKRVGWIEQTPPPEKKTKAATAKGTDKKDKPAPVVQQSPPPSTPATKPDADEA